MTSSLLVSMIAIGRLLMTEPILPRHRNEPKPSRRQASHIQRGVERIVLNEFAARLDHFAHQLDEKIVSLVGMLDLHAQKGPRVFIQRGFPKLFRVHFTKAFVALQRHALAAPFEDRREKLT